MQHVFSDQKAFCQAYFDDLIIFTKSTAIEDHLRALDAVLQRCQDQELYVKLAKCTFCSAEIPCLGDNSGRDGVRMDPDKIRVKREWPPPRTKRELQSFLGTCVYVLKFCENYADISAPLVEATKGKTAQEQIQLTPEQRDCFTKLKTVLTSPPVLAHPDSSKDFHIRMDASDYAVGGYLYQLDADGKERVIAYNGRKLNRAELMYPTREKELLAALHAMRVWRVYLVDKPFFVNTDHRTLQTILEQKTCSQRLARWLNELGLYQPLLRWIPGDTNIVADAISRNSAFQPKVSTHYVSLASLLRQLTTAHETEDSGGDVYLHYARSRPSILEQCTQLYPEDSVFGPLYQLLQSSQVVETTPPVGLHRRIRANINHFFLEDDILYFQPRADAPRRVCVPDSQDLKDAIIYEHHNVASSGHPGCLKTLLALQDKFYWLHMKKTVKRYVTTCEMCQRIKVSQRKPADLLHPLEIPDRRWSQITIDFITGLPSSRHGLYDAVWVIVDRLTKRAHFIPTTTTCTAEEAAKIFRDQYQRLHGLPDTITSDRDSKFTYTFWSKLMKFQNTQLQLSSAFRPDTDGQTERTNHFIADYLRAFVSPLQTDWSELLSLAEFAYNSRVHPSTGMTPFVADLGYNPRYVSEIALPTRRGQAQSSIRFVEHQQAVLQQCQVATEVAQATMKFFHDRNRPTHHFEPGDQVLLDTTNLDLPHVGVSGKRKLAPRFIGPYPVVQSTTPDTYKIGLPPGIRIHDEFHVSYLRPYHFDENPRRLNDVPRLITREGHEGFQIQAIVGKKVRRGTLHYKVRWYERDVNDSWEPATNLTQAQNLIDIYEKIHQSPRPRRSTRHSTPSAPR